MSNQSIGIAASLVSAIIVFAVYSYYMFGLYQGGAFEGAGASTLVGKSAIVLIVASIIAHVVVRVAFMVLNSMVTREVEPLIVDEREELIELKAMKIESIAFGICFVTSMIVLALALAPVYVVFLLIIASMFATSFLGALVKLYLFRRGV